MAGRTVRPDGTGMGDGLAGSCAADAGERTATARPAVPTATATSPAPTASAASGHRAERREWTLRQGRCRVAHKLNVVART